MQLFACRKLLPGCLPGSRFLHPKTWLIMKLVIFLLTTLCFQVQARGYGQVINLTEQNVSLETVLKKIKKQSGFNLVYRSEWMRETKKVTVNLKNATIDDALNICFKNQPLTYELIDKIIVVKKSTNNKISVVAEKPTDLALDDIVITGKVVDNNDNPLANVSIAIKGSGKGTYTANDGSFSISVADKEAVLVISYVGMQTQEITVGNNKIIKITLNRLETSSDDIVVVAYGKQKKVTVTGAISSIQTKEIKQSPAANLAVTLAGRLPGLTAIQTSGEPGRDITQLFIRGQGTINAQNPIILVDGIERDLTFIDPNEVESVTILKDASSTAIFGVRGANGVILITTKRGTSEIPEINFTAEGGAQGFTSFVTPVNSYEYSTLLNLARANDGLDPAFSSESVEKYKTGVDPLRFPNTDWRKILIKDYSFQQRYNLNISGASKAMKYFVNAGYLRQGGQFNTEKNLPYDPSFFLHRYNFRSNIDVQLNKSLKAFLNVAGYLEKQNSPAGVLGLIGADFNNTSAVNSILDFALASNATVPGPLAPNGEVMTSLTGPVGSNPAYGQLNRAGYIQSTRSNVTATFGMDQSLDFITKGLSIKVIGSFDSKLTNNLVALKNYVKYVQIIDPNLNGQDGQDSVYYRPFDNATNTPLNITGVRNFTSLSNFQGHLSYDRNFKKHTLSGLLLYQQQQTLIDQQLPFNLRGFSTRLSYGFNNRYFAEFNAGYNGSEQFAKGKRFGFFPAVSAAWAISNEDFLSDSRVITLLKLRASYGTVGNDRIGSRRFLYLDDIQVTGGGYASSLGNGQTINMNLLKNENLTWEVSRKTNIGFELGIFNELTLVADIFHERRNNVLRAQGTVPVLNGLPSSALPPLNSGVIENKGYEIELNYRKAFTKEVSFLAKVNFNYAHNKQLFADEPLLPDDYVYRYRQTGFRIGQPFGYIVERYFKDRDDIANSPVQVVGGHESRPGDFKYVDLNGDNVINERDLAPIGYSKVPEYTYGGAFSLNYKGLDISLLFQGISNVSNFFPTGGGPNNYYKRALESWTEERQDKGEIVNFPRLTTQPSPNEISNTFFLTRTNYLRLKNLEIGYTLPLSISEKIGSKRIRIYTNGLNLLTWHSLPTKDYDPELTNGSSYPILRIFNFGLNAAF